MKISVLLIEDDEDDYVIVKELLEEIEGVSYVLEWQRTFEEGYELLMSEAHDVYLIDYQLGAQSGIELIRRAAETGAKRPMILLTGAGDRAVDLAAMQAGAADFLVKGQLDADLLERAIRYAIQQKRFEEERQKRVYEQMARVKAEERELEYRTLAETIPQIVWSSRADGWIDYTNQRWHEYTGMSFVKTRGTGWKAGVHADDIPRAEAAWRRAVKEDVPYEVEFRIKRDDGMYRWHLVRALPVRDDEGSIIKWFGTCTDIEDQKEEQRQKDEFISIASHELKTPITTMRVYSELLEKYFRTEKDERRQDYARKIIVHADKLTRLVEDLLDVNRISAQKLQIQTEEFDMDELLHEVVEDLQSWTESHHLQLKGKAKSNIVADRFRIAQVLNNLITNAIKYSPSADKVEIQVKKEGDWVVVKVIDFGVGIPDEAREHIFKQFYRFHDMSVKRFKSEGFGLGLFITNEIVRLHNGKIEVKSKEGKGSTFTVKLPVG